ncbi:PREDICTED: CDGSH iron-sulfur domain-containing protein 3, mitochondrial isoform X2 [Trachymyrmex cornetzi]|uniref:CDGSH iron-sulfur domain-containing protein 3, mitochondrial isoform X1 n=1 Tax=Trachymyrmex cornetzi TaxID=471704 RepID=UPI00084F28EB|nr:PREDICTED: CDGSH iron-sulfur domain-containing protein 3, mitochondrial isoform X1 [Trachymyrmex cornetzi]XP_018364742.1 PREDICTED: CDGSH iron-sulfur domain-containing protein 3, mitochondrial isoform X2 [Trachymyrmex cornetzi]
MNILNRYPQFARLSALCHKNVSRFSTEKTDSPPIPVNPLKDVYSANDQTGTGVIYDKKPFRILLKTGKNYSWCLCGRSKNQPFCDGTHRDIFLKIKLRPIRFTVTETKHYWLCNCKQTLNRPFCDGTHKRQDIQEKRI